jgi:hypothetical protein
MAMLMNSGKNLHFFGIQRRGFVLDLSNCDIGLPRTVQVFERYWVDSVNRFIDLEEIWADASQRQLARSEWKYLNHTLWDEDVETYLRDFLNELVESVFKMIDVARIR